MPKRIPPLSDIQVKNAKPKASDYKLSDGYGLYLLSPQQVASCGVYNIVLMVSRKCFRLGHTLQQVLLTGLE